MDAPEQRIIKARTRMLYQTRWFGMLSLRLRLESDASVGTIGTNGTVLKYDPDWLRTVSEPQLIGVVAHEVMHCALGHPWRVGQRDLHRWNEACDYAINPLLISQGFELPDGYLDELRFHGLSADVIYAIREHEQEQKQQDQAALGSKPQPGTGQDGQPDGQQQPQPGQFERAPKPEMGMPEKQDASQESAPVEGKVQSQLSWEIAAEQATMVTRRGGVMPGDIERAMKASRESQVDWRQALQEFVAEIMPSDYSWVHPNRRFIGQGVYLPGMTKEGCPRIGIAVDSSGSVSQAMLNQVAAEITAILHEVRPESVEICYCDSEVRGTDSFSPDDPEIELHAIGGGGTRFQPALDHFSNLDEPVAALVFITDLQNEAGEVVTDPGIPTIWVAPERVTRKSPFGQTIRIPGLR